LKELKINVTNEEGEARAMLQNGEILACLKTIDGHEKQNIFKRW
jgi:hypothetical protein